MGQIQRIGCVLLLGGTLLACSQAPQEQAQITAEAPKTVEKPFKQYSAAEFFETTTLFGSAINHDGSAALVTSDASGVFNAYRYPLDGSAPTQLTHSDTDSINGLSWFPADDRILYSSDQGGNELNHLYVLNADGAATDITPGEGHRALFYGWHNNDKQFFVATNERDNKAMDLYLYNIEDFSRALIFENTDALGLQSVSDDGRWVVISKVNTNADDDLFIVDLNAEDKSPKHITPHEGNVTHAAYTFTPDNQYLIFGSDQGSEFSQAYRYELSSGTTTQEYAADWDVAFYYFSENGKYRVAGINADAQTKLDIVDTTTGKALILPALPEGDLNGVNFSKDEKHLVFYINSDVSPSNLYSLSIGAENAKRLTNSLSPAMDEIHLVSSEVIRYKSFDELEIPSLLFKPKQASADNKVPGIIFIHGGPGGQTRKGYNALMQHLVNHGYAVLGVNNRGSNGYGKTFFHLDDKRHGEDDLQDIVFGKKYLQSLDWIDNEKIVVMGGSYGGYLTMAAMTFTDEFQLGINIFGVTNWVRTLESIPPWWESFRQYLYDELGDPATDKERLHRISPLFHADKVKKPVLVVQGANDPRVLQVESDEMVAAIRANNVPVEYVLFDDEGHGFRKKANRITAQEAYLSFLKTHL
ncbi:S9 family peptidase [Aliiglaciecola sp. CAU 1673]|uniref:S9 family peptidase n=1 Tax=Aliiglaciecola sp. CAU 1673 TaxID=3032595 RepID=UPI0023D9DAF6|nr:S9 family peptidase [Aliiglaciecola sp. CAU 1673]MDF2177874.1 S9 family peptidase [Aliiglaciecola sp. CAU 1673]